MVCLTLDRRDCDMTYDGFHIEAFELGKQADKCIKITLQNKAA